MAREQPVHSFYVDKRTRRRVGETLREYLGFFRGSENHGAGSRKSEYATMTNDFYDLVTYFYEFGWGPAFHFAPRFKNETFQASLARAEYLLATRLGLAPGMKVLFWVPRPA